MPWLTGAAGSPGTREVRNGLTSAHEQHYRRQARPADRRAFAPYRGRLALVLAVIVTSSALSVVGALLVKVVFDKALFPPGGPDLTLLADWSRC